jgi:hypothetical protein
VRLGRRLARLEGRGGLVLTPDALRYAEHLAAVHGLSVTEVVAEAEALLGQAAAAGRLHPLPRLAAFAAGEMGRDAGEVLAEVEGAVAAWRTRRS